MAVSYARSWGDEVADISEREEFQTCEIRIVDPKLQVGGDYDVDTHTYTDVEDEGIIYSGRARFIPVRAGVFQDAGGQVNTSTIRAGRIQVPSSERGLEIDSGCKVFFTDVPFNGALARRVANVSDDFQGSSTASRTFHVMLDADGVV